MSLVRSAAVAPNHQGVGSSRLIEGRPEPGDEGWITRRRRLVRALLDAIERGDARAAKPVLGRVWPAPATKGEPKPGLTERARRWEYREDLRRAL